MQITLSFALATWLMQQCSVANSFAPRNAPFLLHRPWPSAPSIRIRQFVATTDEIDSEVGYSKREKAITALEKLLWQQQADVELTEKLLEDLRNPERKPANENESLSYALSIVSGFDYGFVSRSQGVDMEIKGEILEHEIPSNIWNLGWKQFWRNWNAMNGEYKDEPDIEFTPEQKKNRVLLEKLTLNSTAIWERETQDGPIVGPWIIKVPYLVLCWLLDVVFEGKYVPSRFFLLETVARMPYFSYITMLHLYETLGFWRRSADVKRIHFAEEMNEFRHLLIMESLGGDQQWWVRFMAQHSAIIYYIVLCLLWAISPSLSYEFSRLLESHAVNTYGQFLDENERALKELPPSLAAVEYYSFGLSDPFYAEIQTSSVLGDGKIRRPGENMQSLYDVFTAIQADESDHVSAMKAFLDPKVALVSPSIERRLLTGIALLSIGLVNSGFGGMPAVVELDGTGVGDVLSESTLETMMAGAAGFVSQLMGGTTGDTFQGAEGVIESVDMVGEQSGLVRALAGLTGFLGGILGSARSPMKNLEKKSKSKIHGRNDDSAESKPTP